MSLRNTHHPPTTHNPALPPHTNPTIVAYPERVYCSSSDTLRGKKQTISLICGTSKHGKN